jgi:NADPH:quinone reductase-like Zn-dependent oxidoreductase
MKTAFRSKYGGAEVLSVKEVDIPTPKENEVLIKVHATTVNRSDCHILTGKPFPMRLFTGLSKPKSSTTGTDFAGQIHAVGKNVTAFTIGDRLMGFRGIVPIASHAQYMLLTESTAARITVPIPDRLQYHEAAACLEGAFYAAGNTLLDLKRGQNAMVYGATGAIGTAYLQYLKYYGVDTTAVCRSEHTELVRSLGAKKVIDYIKEDFTKDTERYDYVFDAVGKSSFAKCKHLLKPKGIYTSAGGAENLLLVLITPLFGGRKVVFKTFNIRTGLQFIHKMIEQQILKPVIDRIYSLDQIAEAFTYVTSGQKVGNVVIKME